MSQRLLIAGFVCCALSLLLFPLGLVALVIGVIALFRGHTAEGAALVVLSLVVPFAGGVILQAFLLKPYRIPSEGMVPTLAVGDRLLVSRGDFDPQRGDIAVFHPPTGAESDVQCGASHRPRQACPTPTARMADVNFIQRIVAGPGDRLAVDAGHVVLNGTRQPERHVRPCGDGPECNLTTPITIPPDHYFMMGDNRGASDDSRFWGPVPGDWIVGRAFFRYWPSGSFGGL